MLHSRTQQVLTVVLLAAVAMVPACSMIPKGRGVQTAAGHETASPPPARQAQNSSAIRTAPPDSDTLAAIEDFLARTRKYKGADAAPATDKPAAPSVNNDRQPMSNAPVGVAAPAAPPRDGTAPNGNAFAASANTGRRRGDVPAQPAPHAAPSTRGAAQQQPQWINVREIPNAAEVAAATTPKPAAPPRASGPALPVLLSVSVSAAPQEVTKPEARQHSSNVPVDVVSSSPSVTWDTLVQTLRDQPDARTNIRRIWELGLAELASNQSKLPQPEMDGYPAETTSLLQSLWAAAAAVRDLLVDPIGAGSTAQDRVEALARAVAQQVDPKIEDIHLCRRVTTFGVYDEMEPGDLVAGRPAQTIVYSELDNLRSKALPDGGGFETQLATRMELMTPDGKSVWSHDEPQIVDRCRRQRRDFFLAQRVTFPATLPAGKYVLKLRVEDLLSQRTVESVHDVEVSSELALAHRPSPQP